MVTTLIEVRRLLHVGTQKSSAYLRLDAYLRKYGIKKQVSLLRNDGLYSIHSFQIESDLKSTNHEFLFRKSLNSLINIS